MEDKDCTGTSVSCYDPGALCSCAKTCSNECKPFHKKKIHFQKVKNFELTITEGQFYLASHTSFRIFSDDLIGIKMQDARLAHRKLHPGETPDYKIEMSSDIMTVFDASKFVPIEDRKFYVRLIVSEPLTFTMPHVYENSGNFLIKFLLKNTFREKDKEKEIRRDNYISIQSSISKMRLLVTPPNAPVGQKIDINVQLSKGSNIKLIWDYGDGNQVTDHISSKFSSGSVAQ